MRVFVLLFNPGTDNEGIHTVQTGNRHKILMFESEDDATRFALLLEAQDFPTPSVEEIDESEIEEFCRQADYDWEIVESGMLAIPPTENVGESDWEAGKQPATTESEMSPAELEKIRRKLEGLL